MFRRPTGLLTAIIMIVTTSCTLISGCQPQLPKGFSVARLWNEANLHAISRDFPAPTVHARNLFHTSAAMWDAWAAFDDAGTGYFVDADMSGSPSDRQVAISFAAYGVLRPRYALADGGSESLAEFDQLMSELCLDPKTADRDNPDTPAGLGHRIATVILEGTRDDGSLERQGYESSDYRPINEPLNVSQSGTAMADPNRWQPLLLDEAITQNGIPLPSGLQSFVGSQWGHVTSFALPSDPDGVPIDPGSPPYIGDPAFAEAVVEVIELSSRLEADGSSMIDIGPTSLGNNPLGTNDGRGYATNPVTGDPYAPQIVDEGDFGRVLAEYWADGPSSETPPGHWNTIANRASDQMDEFRIGGVGPEVDRLEWDVKLYFALNGANHDAAIAAWGLKAVYDYVRPISMIRYMGGLGQSTNRAQPMYHEWGLPLIDGLIELVTDESARERHAGLTAGTIAIRAWSGPAPDHSGPAGVAWIPAVDWVPYQAPTFVTPSFAGYVSGHSAFSRASAEVLTAITGSEFFPGGLGEWLEVKGSLAFELGPNDPVTFQWASYRDAADQAGRSRLYGGIHVEADDLGGRIVGAECGIGAWSLAQRYFAGDA